jgi:hypothetical protein
LVSISPDDVACIREALGSLTSSSAASQCLARFNSALASCPESTEDDLQHAWVDGGSVQVRAITSFGDPVDLGSEEARAFAAHILECAARADERGDRASRS